MRWKILFLILFGLSLYSDVFGEVLTQRDTLYLREPTKINGRLSADYDTLLCWITRLNGVVVAQPLMVSDGKGRWYGKVVDISLWRGHYRAEYYGIYDDGNPATSDTFARFEAFSVVDTTAFHGTAEATCTPTGENTVIVWVKDIADSTGLEGFLVYFEDSITGGDRGYTHTNSAGVCTVGLSDGHYTIYLRAPRWTITSPVYKTINSDQTLTYYATGITPSPPPVDSVCVVYGYVWKKDGSAYAGAKIEIWMDKTGVTYHGDLIDVITHSVVYTDTTGRFEFSSGIYPNDLLLPANTRWSFKITVANRIWTGTVKVPVADSWELEIP